MIDKPGCRRPRIGRGSRIAHDHELAALARLRAEHQIGAVAVVLARGALHAEMFDIEVTHLGVVRAAIGDVIDPEHLEAARRLRLGGIARRIDGGGERDSFAELAAVDPTALEVSDEISNEAFHAGPPWVFSGAAMLRLGEVRHNARHRLAEGSATRASV